MLKKFTTFNRQIMCHLFLGNIYLHVKIRKKKKTKIGRTKSKDRKEWSYSFVLF